MSIQSMQEHLIVLKKIKTINQFEKQMKLTSMLEKETGIYIYKSQTILMMLRQELENIGRFI